MQLTTTDPKDRVLIECIGLRLRGACNEYNGDLMLDERLRHYFQRVLDEHKTEYPHKYDVVVKLVETQNRPRIEINVGGLNVCNFE